MPWIIAGGALLGSVVSSQGGGGGGGGESTQTPFFPAIPGMVANANAANGMMDGYLKEPFNPQQLAAINNLYGQSDYMHQLIPGLLQQMQGQQLGYDRNNPTARPQPWNWGLLANAPASAGGDGGAPQAGLLAPSIGQSAGSGIGLLGSQGVRNTAPGVGAQDHRPIAEQPAPAPAPAPAAPQGPLSQAFRQAHLPPGMAEATNVGYKALGGSLGAEQTAAMNAGYGGFQYGMNVKDIMADPRMEADARMYFAMGGEDPFGVYQGARLGGEGTSLHERLMRERQANQP